MSVRFSTEKSNSFNDSVNVSITYAEGGFWARESLKAKLLSLRPKQVLLGCALLVIFLLALSAFVNSLGKGDNGDLRRAATTTEPAAAENSAFTIMDFTGLSTKNTIQLESLEGNTTNGSMAFTPSTTLPATPTVKTTALSTTTTSTTTVTTTTTQAPKCGANWDQLGDKCYRTTSSKSFPAAEAECERNYRGSLASIHSEDDGILMAKRVRTRHAMEKEFYIGLTRNFAGHWVWMDRTVFDFEAWKPSEPNTTSDHCVQVSSILGPLSGRWSVVACSTELPALCQRDIASFTGDADKDEWIHRSQCTKCEKCRSCPLCDSCCYRGYGKR